MKLRIYLADLTHTGQGIAMEAFPLNIGLVASYCLKKFKDDVEIQLFKFPEDLKKAIDEKKPHILGCSNYAWNCNLGYHFASYVKSIDKSIITVFGGTNYPYDIYNQKLFLQKRPNIDIHTFYEGENSFLKIVEATLSNMGSVRKIFEKPIDGCQFLNNDGHLVCGQKLQRIKFLNEIPSPYATGLLDKFFKDKLSPLGETARGCPFKCNFCNAGDDYYNKVNKFSDEYVEEELTYIAKKSNKHDVGHLTLADNNFGMIKRDAKTAQLIDNLKHKYNWPKSLTVWTGKNSKERVIEATKLLGETINISMSVQSMDPKVLKEIERSNIKLDHYQAIAKELNTQGRPQHAELVVPMPEETFETHLKGLSDLIDTDISRVEFHTLRMLHGTPYGDDKKYLDKYGFKVKHRLVPRDFGKYGDDYIFDTELAAVSTKSFSFNDHVESRKLNLIVNLFFNGYTFKPVSKYVLSNNLKRSDWIKYIYRNMDKFDISVKRIIDSFVAETKSELWDSEKELTDYFSNEENYKKLVSCEMGGNVVYKHLAWILSEKSQILIDNVCQMAKDFINSNTEKDSNSNINREMDEIKKYIKCVTSDSFKFGSILEVNKKLKFNYDIFSWLKTEQKTKLKDFFDENFVIINFAYDHQQLEVKRDALNRYGDDITGTVKLTQRLGGIHRLHRKAAIAS